MRRPVETYKRKFDGSTKGAWHGELLEESPDGWLVVFYAQPPHEVAGEPVAYALRYMSTTQPLNVLVNFNWSGEITEFQCDASMPAVVSRGRIDFVDLDLDMMVDASGAATDRDFQTFEERRVSMNYSDEAVRLAHEGLELAHQLFDRARAPFDGSPAHLLRSTIAAAGSA